MVSKFKLDKIWPHFDQKWLKTGKIRYFAVSDRFSYIFFEQTLCQMLSDLNFETRFGIFSSKRIV